MKPTFENATLIYEIAGTYKSHSIAVLKSNIVTWTVDNQKLKMNTNGETLRFDLKSGWCTMTNFFAPKDSIKIEHDRIFATSIEEIIENFHKLLERIIEKEEIMELRHRTVKENYQETLKKWNERTSKKEG